MEKKESNMNNFLRKRESILALTIKDVIDCMEMSIDNIHEIDDISGDDGDFSFIFRINDGYGYNLRLEEDKKNYFRLELSFGDMHGLLSESEIKDLKFKINESNKKLKCAKGYLEEVAGEDGISNELNFSVCYEAYILPSPTKKQLSEHIKLSKALVDIYVSQSLDVVYSE